MKKKTGSEVETDVYRLIYNTSIRTSITGDIYKAGTRPLNSDKEDVVIGFVAGLDGQVQDGVVNINFYAPDIIPEGQTDSVVKMKDTARCRELEVIALDAIASLPTDEYDFSLAQMIATFKGENADQHYVNVKLEFRRITE